MEMKKISIYEIAREAGVSPSTVSRTLNQPEKVSKEKRDRILEIVRKYDFKPNALAKGLSSARSGVIGILTGAVDSPFHSQLDAACVEAAQQRNYVLLLAGNICSSVQESRQLERMYEQRVDAVIILGGNLDSREVDEQALSVVNYLAENVPVVVMGKPQGVPCYEVRIDETDAMERAVEYLAGLGHERIAFWGGERNVYSTLEKRLAYQRLVRKYGLEYREEWLQYGGWEYDEGYSFMKKMLPGKLPTAVIGINDQFACGLMNAALDAGISVPGQLSVLGFDGTYASEMVRPGLCSVACDYRELAGGLVGTAVGAAQGEQPERQQQVKTHLIQRGSCGPSQTPFAQTPDREPVMR